MSDNAQSKRTALLVVDVQPTFCEGGALPVQGGNSVAERIAALLNGDHGYDLVATTQDWHIDPGDHFSDEPDFVDTWPPHGMAGSEEAALHPLVAAASGRIDINVYKGMYAAAYSGFEGADMRGYALNDLLAQQEITHVDVVGLAFDYCVRATALDAAQHGYITRVLKNHTASVAPETEQSAHAALSEAGVSVH